MERDAAQALYADLHEKAPYHDGTFTDWEAKRSSSHPYHFNDGVSFGVAEADPSPWDLFTTRVDASPVQPPPEPTIEDPRGG